VNGGLQHHAVLRRADVDAASWSSAVTLRSISSPILSLVSRRSLETSAHHVLVDLDDLQLRLGDLALGLARATLCIARGSPLRRAESTFERGQARQLHQMLVVEITDADEFLLHQRDFPVLGFLLRAHPSISSLSC
jgi:hypothetical protein